jgi:mono/diheme cytochrome c family protein
MKHEPVRPTCFTRFRVATAAAAVTLAALPSGAAAQLVDFGRDVLPILTANCFACHGPDADKRKADLRLDVREAAVSDANGTEAVVPGKPADSELITRVTAADGEGRMPPPKAGPRLSAEQVRTLRTWIEQGAPYAEHWAFVPPKRPQPPRVQEAAWPRTPVDNFVLHRQEQLRLPHADRASREVLIRRATLDLLGLPPTPEEVRAFVADDSPNAYEKLIDRLLASPHYGERWGRHWLDVVRYADSGGFETDIFFSHAWRYRDYVIRSFNSDKPFDRFVREQIAGDELSPGDAEAEVATGLYTIGAVLQEAAMVPGKFENDWLTDAVDTTGSAFLGLTVGCARCHDHKYDPLRQRDYYALQAVFAGSCQSDIKRDGSHSEVRARQAVKTTLPEFELEQAKVRARTATDPAVRAESLRQVTAYYMRKDPELQRRIDESQRYLALQSLVERCRQAGPSDQQALLAEVGQRALDLGGKNDPDRLAYRALKTEEEKRRFLVDFGRKNLDLKKPANLIEDIDRFQRELGEKFLAGSEIPTRVLADAKKPEAVRLLKRGELDAPGEAVAPGLPVKLAGGLTIDKLPPNRWRTELANWVSSPRNPLTARVFVNRVWQWHFGQGLVRTPNDFGVRGERPTHPELLDWLAVEFVEHGWSLKHLHRVIMLSSAYQMASAVDGATLTRDPDNVSLTRFQPRRVEAEVIWDSVRAAAGTLNVSLYGLPVAPPLDDQEQIGNFRKWPTSTPEESNRRAVYLLARRSFRMPMLAAFDLPENTSSCGQRDVTTVPNQALTLLNNRTMKEQAAAFAARLLRETDGSPGAVLALAWRYAYGRDVTAEERARAVEFLRSRGRGRPGDGDALPSHAVAELCLALFNTNEFLYLP